MPIGCMHSTLLVQSCVPFNILRFIHKGFWGSFARFIVLYHLSYTMNKLRSLKLFLIIGCHISPHVFFGRRRQMPHMIQIMIHWPLFAHRCPYITVGQRKKVTEEGNCSYYLQYGRGRIKRNTLGLNSQCSRGRNIALFGEYDMTWSKFRENAVFLMYLVQEIWQFKVFAGKDVTQRNEEGYLKQFRGVYLPALCVCLQ